jgi:hypothetical protein
MAASRQVWDIRRSRDKATYGLSGEARLESPLNVPAIKTKSPSDLTQGTSRSAHFTNARFSCGVRRMVSVRLSPPTTTRPAGSPNVALPRRQTAVYLMFETPIGFKCNGDLG